MDNRTCNLCNEIKPATDFYGRNKACIKCYNKRGAIYKKNWKKLNPELAKERSRLYGKISYHRSGEEDIQRRLGRWKSGAKRRGIIWSIEYEDIKDLPLICYYSGIELTFKRGEFNTLSLDRLDSSKGYEKGNVVFSSVTANYMKSELSQEEFISMCKKIAAHHK